MAMQSIRHDDGRDRALPTDDRPRYGRQRTLANGGAEGLAQALGWFSIGLGLAELVARRRLAALIGVKDDRGMLPMVGLREVANGIGILTQRRPAGWLWMRVAGDAMDLSLLIAALNSGRVKPDRVMTASAAVVGVTILDVLCSQQLSQGRPAAESAPKHRVIRTTKTITVNRPPEEVYRYWRDFENLPRFMSHLESVQATGDDRSHWKAKALAGTTFEWDAEITEDRPNELIAWRSVPGGDIQNEGSVRFERASGGRETRIKVTLRYDPPGGTLGATVAKLFGQEPGQQMQEDLRRFKQLMETGEVATTEGQPSGRKSGVLGRVSVTRILEGELR